MPSKREQLIQDGYCVFENILTPEMVERTNAASNRLLDAQDAEYFEAQKSTGSLISIYNDDFFAELVTWPKALNALREMGFDQPTFSSGFIISKPPHSPPLFWHQDWWGWNDPVSYEPLPQQVFLMYYLVDTSRENGCLRLIEGSHLKRHPLHDLAPEAHTEDLRRVSDPDHPAYQSYPDERDVPVHAGDLVIGDSRLLHSAHANKSDQWRTVITLWYHPIYNELPESMRARLANRHPIPDHWSEDAAQKIAPLMPIYEGEGEELEWNRVPGSALV